VAISLVGGRIINLSAIYVLLRINDIIVVGMALRRQFDDYFVGKLFVEEKLCGFLGLDVIVKKGLIILFILYLDLVVNALWWILMKLINNIDYDRLGCFSEKTNMSNEKLGDLLIIFLLATAIWLDDVSPVVLKLQIPAQIFPLLKNAAKFVFLVNVLLHSVEEHIPLLIWYLASYVALLACRLHLGFILADGWRLYVDILSDQLIHWNRQNFVLLALYWRFFAVTRWNIFLCLLLFNGRIISRLNIRDQLGSELRETDVMVWIGLLSLFE